MRLGFTLRLQMGHQLSILWSQVYTGASPSDYLVHFATWTGLKVHRRQQLEPPHSNHGHHTTLAQTITFCLRGNLAVLRTRSCP